MRLSTEMYRKQIKKKKRGSRIEKSSRRPQASHPSSAQLPSSTNTSRLTILEESRRRPQRKTRHLQLLPLWRCITFRHLSAPVHTELFLVRHRRGHPLHRRLHRIDHLDSSIQPSRGRARRVRSGHVLSRTILSRRFLSYIFVPGGVVDGREKRRPQSVPRLPIVVLRGLPWRQVAIPRTLP